MKFNYQARTKKGEIRTGAVEASSKDVAIELLQRYGLYVTYLSESGKSPFFAKKIKLFQRTSLKDIVLFSRQLSIMFKSKVPLIESLRSIANQIENQDFQEKIFNISKEIEGGSPLSKALSKYPKVFSQFYISMVKAGEASGRLDESLDYLANHLEKEYQFRSEVRGAMMYPIMVLIVIFVVLFILTYSVMPNFERIFAESGAQLPQVTKMVIGFSHFLKANGLFVLIGLFVLSVFIYEYYNTKKGKKFFDKLFLKLPIIGPLLKKIYLSQIAENISTLISGGLMITKTLGITGDIIGNLVYKEAVYSAQDDVKRGIPISSVFAGFPDIFPPIFIQMILIGEKTGNLENTLKNIAQFYQKESERSIANVLSLLEPMVIIFFGIVVGGLVFSVFLPLYKTVGLGG